MSQAQLLSQVKRCLVKLDLDGVLRSIEAALSEGMAPYEIIMKGLTPGLEEIGKLYERGEYFLSEIIYAAYIMEEAMKLLGPKLEEEMAAGRALVRGTVVLGTVKGDIHNIGKNIAAMLFKGSGFNVVDIGEDVSAEQFIEAVKRHRAEILGMSALMSTTAPYFKVVVKKLKEAGLRDKVFTIIGGAIVDEEIAKDAGVDAWCRDAALGVKQVIDHIEKRKATHRSS